MRNSLFLFLALGFAACGGYRPVDFSGPVTAANPVQCAREQIEQMGYEVASDPQAGAVTGIQVNEQPWYKTVLGFRPTADRITATVADGQLRVVATSSDPREASEGGMADTGLGATRSAELDARQVVMACGEFS